MQKFQYILAKFPFSCIIIAGIWVLCFMNIPDTPLSNIRLIDKWTHAVMYLVLGFRLFLSILEQIKKPNSRRLCFGFGSYLLLWEDS